MVWCAVVILACELVVCFVLGVLWCCVACDVLHCGGSAGLLHFTTVAATVAVAVMMVVVVAVVAAGVSRRLALVGEACVCCIPPPPTPPRLRRVSLPP